MSMVGELTFFLGFQIKQEEIDIFFSQEKYAKNLVSKFGMDKTKLKSTPADTYLKMTKDTVGEKQVKPVPKCYWKLTLSDCQWTGYCICSRSMCPLSGGSANVSSS